MVRGEDHLPAEGEVTHVCLVSSPVLSVTCSMIKRLTQFAF